MDVKFDNTNEMFEWMHENLSYFDEDEPVFKFNYTNNGSPLTVITGNNASGNHS